MSKPSDWEGALRKPPLKCSRIAASASISWRRGSSPQVCCSTEERGNEEKSWKHGKTPSLPNARIDNFRKKTSFARRTDPKTQPLRPPLLITSSSTQASSPTPEASWTSRTKPIKGIIPPPPPPPRKTTKMKSCDHQPQILRWQRVPSPQGLPTNMQSSLGTTTRVSPNRSQNTPTTRTRTQQRRDRAKQTRCRMIAAYMKVTDTLRKWNQLRYNNHKNDGIKLPSTGVAMKRREEQKQAMQKRFEDLKEQAKNMVQKPSTCERGLQAIRAPPRHHISSVGQSAYGAIDRPAASG